MKNRSPSQSTDWELIEAMRAWHAGQPLSDRQIDMIDEARRAVLVRAYGLAADVTPQTA